MNSKDNHSVKREIINAFMELMTKKSYMDITITDIINKAQVARASFYRNFNSINDVIDTIIDEMSNEFVDDVFPTLVSDNERKWREFLFEYFYRFARNQKKIGFNNPQNISVMFSRMDAKMRQRETEFPSETLKEKYTAFGKLGLINNIAKKWMDSGMKETPEEMIDYIMSFITKF